MSVSNENRPPIAILETGHALIDEPTLAVRLGVSRSTLQAWRYNGRGPRFIKIGRMIQYRVDDIEQFLLARTHGDAA